MKNTSFLLTGALCGLILLPQTQAQQGYDFTENEGYDFSENEGYDFSDDEEEIAAQKKSADDKRALQSLLYNGAQYALACRKAYQEEIVWPVSACCDGIIGSNDLVECTKDPAPADLHREAVSKITGKHPFAPDAGQFLEGILSRTTLQQAKPNLTAQQYAEIDHVISRSENLMKWFMGSFAKACAVHDYDFLKEVQRVVRFKEYLKSAKVEELDEKYYAMMHAYTGSYVSSRIYNAEQRFSNNIRENSVSFFRHFHNSISRAEREQWISFIVLGGSSRSSYLGPEFGINARFEHNKADDPYMYYDISGTRVIPAGTNAATLLASYMHYFDFWTDSRITATMDLGDKTGNIVRIASNEFLSRLDKMADEIVIREDADFKHTIRNSALYALNKLTILDDELSNFLPYLEENSKFLKNRRKTNSKGTLANQIQVRAEEASRLLDHMMKIAGQHVPASAPERQVD